MDIKQLSRLKRERREHEKQWERDVLTSHTMQHPRVKLDPEIDLREALAKMLGVSPEQLPKPK